MKAFIAKNKYMSNGSRDYLIIASTKKEALKAFEEYGDMFGYRYLKKDFIEVGIERIDLNGISISPSSYERYGFGECFDFDIFVKTDYSQWHYIEKRVISKDEKTTKELIKLFKNEYSSFFKNEL